MVEHDFEISRETQPLLEPFLSLPRADQRRVELLSFLIQATTRPLAIAYEADDKSIRWTRLNHIGVAWRIDLARKEIDVLHVWDEDDG